MSLAREAKLARVSGALSAWDKVKEFALLLWKGHRAYSLLRPDVLNLFEPDVAGEPERGPRVPWIDPRFAHNPLRGLRTGRLQDNLDGFLPLAEAIFQEGELLRNERWVAGSYRAWLPFPAFPVSAKLRRWGGGLPHLLEKAGRQFPGLFWDFDTCYEASNTKFRRSQLRQIRNQPGAGAEGVIVSIQHTADQVVVSERYGVGGLWIEHEGAVNRSGPGSYTRLSVDLHHPALWLYLLKVRLKRGEEMPMGTGNLNHYAAFRLLSEFLIDPEHQGSLADGLIFRIRKSALEDTDYPVQLNSDLTKMFEQAKQAQLARPPWVRLQDYFSIISAKTVEIFDTVPRNAGDPVPYLKTVPMLSIRHDDHDHRGGKGGFHLDFFHTSGGNTFPARFVQLAQAVKVEIDRRLGRPRSPELDDNLKQLKESEANLIRGLLAGDKVRDQ